MESGIYKITNDKNGKNYIGSSININKRKSKHFYLLERGIHDNKYLQQSYSKYGKDFFSFEILELCVPEQLVEKENYYIGKYNSANLDFGYNLALVNEFRRNIYNDDVKKRLSKHNMLKNKNFSTFSLTNIETDEIFIFDTLVDAANHLIEKGFSKASSRNIRMKLSYCLRNKKINNGAKFGGSFRKTCYKHKLKIIN